MTPVEAFEAGLKALQSDVLFQLVTVTIGPHDPTSDTIYLANVKAHRPGGGAGTAMMILLCQLADHCGAKLELVITAPSPIFERLKDWYGRFGFSGRWGSLARQPRRWTSKAS